MIATSPPRLTRKTQWLFQTLWVVWAVWLTYHYFGHESLLGQGFWETIRKDLCDARLVVALSVFLSLLKTLLLDLAFIVVFWAWGRRLGRILGRPGTGPMVPILETALGLAGVQLFWMGWGLNRLWREEMIFPIALSALGLALWDAAQILRSELTHHSTLSPLGPNLMGSVRDKEKTLILGKRVKRNAFTHLDLSLVYNLILGGLCLLAVFLSLGQAALPDVYYDSLVYHLSTLNDWTQTHGISNLSTNLYAAFPFGGEMDFLGAFLWGSGEAVKGLNAFILVLLALASGGWAWEESGKNSAFLAAGLVLGFPLAVTGAWTTRVDLLQALFILLFYYCLGRACSSVKTGGKSWFWRAGIMAGAALAVKYTALLGIGTGLLVWGPGLLGQREKKLSVVLGLLVPPLILFLPWLIKNWAYTANPLYPYLGSWFGGHGLPPERMAQLMRDHVEAFAPGETWTLWVQRIFTRDLGGTIAPVLFSFFPLLFLGKGTKGQTLKLLAAGGISLIGGLCVTHLVRLGLAALMPCFVGMSLFAGRFLDKNFRRAWKVAVLVFFILNFLQMMRVGVLYYGDGRVWGGAENREDYLSQCGQTATYYPLAQDCAGWFKPDEKCLVAGDARGLYYSPPVITNSVFDVQVMAGLARKRRDGDGIALALKEMGVEGLVVLREEGIRLSEEYSQYPLSGGEWKRLDDYIQRHTRLMELTPLGGIYRISFEPLTEKGRVVDLFLCFKPLSKL